MRLHELFEDISDMVELEDEPGIGRISPLSITPERFLFARASGPLGLRDKNGKIKPAYKKEED